MKFVWDNVTYEKHFGLAQFWGLETRSRLFYDLKKMAIFCDLLIFST